jgi:ATP-dependent DNA helicase
VKRNDRMTNLFYALHLMEREGSGYDKMYEVQLTFGKQVPRVEEGDDYVVAVVERRIVSQEAIKVMQTASQNIPLKQKQLICLGMIAQAGSISGSELIRNLELKDNVSLRPWLRPLLDMGLVETNDGKTKGVEYRIVPQLLRDSNFKGKTTLKRIEQHRLRELILEDLKLYGASSIKDINARIGEEIPRRTLSRAIKELIDSGYILSSGYGKTLRYKLSRQD